MADTFHFQGKISRRKFRLLPARIRCCQPKSPETRLWRMGFGDGASPQRIDFAAERRQEFSRNFFEKQNRG